MKAFLSPMPSRPRLAQFLLAVACSLFVAACGGSEEAEQPRVASVDDLATTTTQAATDTETVDAEPEVLESSTTTTEAESESEEMSPIEEQELALLDLSACMREEGIDEFPDVAVDNEGAIDVASVLQSGVDVQSAEFGDALDVCDDNVEDITFGAAAVPDPTEIIEQLYGFTQCLRDEGIDAGDVTLPELLTRQSNVPADVGSRDEGIAYFFEVDPEDPAVIAAIGECEGELVGLPGA
jgi:hypothetical protein